MDTIVFDDIKVALQGTVVLPTPRVSRETIISVLQTHTDLIMSLRKVNSTSITYIHLLYFIVFIKTFLLNLYRIINHCTIKC